MLFTFFFAFLPFLVEFLPLFFLQVFLGVGVGVFCFIYQERTLERASCLQVRRMSDTNTCHVIAHAKSLSGTKIQNRVPCICPPIEKYCNCGVEKLKLCCLDTCKKQLITIYILCHWDFILFFFVHVILYPPRGFDVLYILRRACIIYACVM